MIDLSKMHPLARRFVPPIAAFLALALFVNLGMWQLDRAAEKEAIAAMFEDDAPYERLSDTDEPELYTPVRVQGRYLPQTVLIDNIVKSNQLGYYVISPVEVRRGEPLLLVNRGFLSRQQLEEDPALLDADSERGELRGRVGRLPRVGVRPGEGFEGQADADWPKVAVYPTADEVAAQLESDVRPYVLLLAPEAANGFVRDWRPPASGASTHYGYAFQWFAMAAAVIAISAWHWRRRRA